MWNTLWRWGQANLDNKRQQIVTESFIRYASKPYGKHKSRVLNKINVLPQMAYILRKNPGLCRESIYWKQLLCSPLPGIVRSEIVKLRVNLEVNARFHRNT
jgi:hypothetical protein